MRQSLNPNVLDFHNFLLIGNPTDVQTRSDSNLDSAVILESACLFVTVCR